MIKTIFRNTFLIGISILALCAVLFFGIQYTQIKNDTYGALKQEAAYAEQGLLIGGEDYLKTLGDENRVTWIDADGNVLYDSEFQLPMDNEKDHAEVSDAMENGEGRKIRTSENSGESTMYYARKCKDGTILRLSRPISAVQKALIAVRPILWVLILVLVISAVLSFRIAKQIVNPINAIDLERPEIDKYPELTPLIDKIQEQKMTIQEEVESREQMRREFSANVSHELKTPLTSISGFAELLSQGVVSDDKVQEFSNDIYKESQRLIALIDDIIKLSRLDENKEEPKWEKVDLYDLSSEVLDGLRPIADKQGIKLSLAGKSTSITGVYALLNEMVYNLCDNAIKYNTPGGSVEVKIATKENGDVALAVKDTGIGIPQKHQKRVFERFYRVDKSHSKEIGGTGLGLSIVKHVAQHHDANVSLESEPGLGTTITIVFPKKTDSAEKKEETKAETEENTKNENE
ncbi:MAG: two-component sensor histidine kinase [Clostridiales bacterium]|nr:two-component sensor histidine kinase [Clostridiales bacterium]